jgi:hypothetical protein
MENVVSDASREAKMMTGLVRLKTLSERLKIDGKERKRL